MYADFLTVLSIGLLLLAWGMFLAGGRSYGAMPFLPFVLGVIVGLAASQSDPSPELLSVNIGAAIGAALISIVTISSRAYLGRLARTMPDRSGRWRIASIPGVGKHPQSVVLSEDGQTAYVLSSTDGTLAVVDLSGHEVLGTVRVGRRAMHVLPLPSGGRALVSLARPFRDRLLIVDTAGGQVIGTITGVPGPRGMAASPDGRSVYVTSAGDSRLWRLDALTFEVTGSAAVGRRPVSVLTSRDGARLYVANLWSNSITVLDAATLTATATIRVATAPTGVGPRSLALNTGGNRLYAACGDGVVNIVDTSTCALTAHLRPAASDGSVAASRRHDEVWYLTDPGAGRLIVLAGDKVVGNVLFGLDMPFQVAVGPDDLLYAARQEGTLDIISIPPRAAENQLA